MRVLYFDIDGALLDWHDNPKPGLLTGGFYSLLASRQFARLVCVSGWAEMVPAEVSRYPADHRKANIYRLLDPLFPDRDWFLSRLELGVDTDHRGFLIDRQADWYYVDDNADQFFTEAYGVEAYSAELGRRTCCPHHSSDGAEVIAWLEAVPPCPDGVS